MPSRKSKQKSRKVVVAVSGGFDPIRRPRADVSRGEKTWRRARGDLK